MQNAGQHRHAPGPGLHARAHVFRRDATEGVHRRWRCEFAKTAQSWEPHARMSGLASRRKNRAVRQVVDATASRLSRFMGRVSDESVCAQGGPGLLGRRAARSDVHADVGHTCVAPSASQDTSGAQTSVDQNRDAAGPKQGKERTRPSGKRVRRSGVIAQLNGPNAPAHGVQDATRNPGLRKAVGDQNEARQVGTHHGYAGQGTRSARPGYAPTRPSVGEEAWA